MSSSQSRIRRQRDRHDRPRTTLVAILLLASAGLTACGQEDPPETIPSPPARTATGTPAVPAGVSYQDDDRLLKDLSRARLHAYRLEQQHRALKESCLDDATYDRIITTRVREDLVDDRCAERVYPIPGRYTPRAQ